MVASSALMRTSIAAGEGHRVLRDAERERRRGSYLSFDKVQAGDRFGDRVFDLEPGVHLEEEVVAGLVVDDELDGPRRVVADRLGESKRSGAQPGLGRIGEVRCRRLFDQLLVAALHGAFTGPSSMTVPCLSPTT